MKNKNKIETFDKVVEEMAEACKANKENNLAIVLYAYLGAKHAGMGRLFAKHCQDFARSGLEMIDEMKKRDNK